MPILTYMQAESRWRLPLLAAVIVLIVVAPFLILRSTTQESLDALTLVSHTRQVEATAHSLSYDVRNVEAAALALGAGIDNPSVRARLRESLEEVPRTLALLETMTRDNPSQQIRLGRLQSRVEQRLRISGRLSESTDATSLQREVNALVTQFEIRTIVNEMIDEEERLLAERTRQSQMLNRRTAALTWSSMAAQLVLLGLVSFFSQRQILSRIEAERGFRRASARAMTVLQTVREPIVLLDDEQRVVMHNAAFAELYGNGDEENLLQGQLLAEVGDGAWDDPVILQRLNDVLSRDRELWDFEQHQRTSDDRDRVMLINARRMPLPAGDGDDRVVLVTVSDISASKAAENHVRELNRQLEGKVAQVSDVNRELEAFSYSVSHDLRAPLRHVGGFADKLGRHLGEDADDTSRHYIEVIGSSAKRMAKLIDDLLVYSRLGRSAIRLQPVDMQSLVAETRAILDANALTDNPDRRIDWRISPMPMVIGDENMLRQVWLNLLGNAVKYSGEREVSVIEVEHERLENGGHHFWVRDNGTGFDMQYAGKLFGVFQRMHKASEFPGTGIGLASVRRVLLRHGGKVWAEARPGEGATFHFELPSSLDTPNADERTA